MYLFELYQYVARKKAAGTEHVIPKHEWPQSWKTTYVKVYERFPVVHLPKPRTHTVLLTESITLRASGREFTHSMSEEDLADLLFYGAGDKDPQARSGVGSRVYASGGARYPLEVYVYVKPGVGSITEGVYHYSPESHQLERIVSCSSSEIEGMFLYPEVSLAQCVFFFTSAIERASVKYGELAYRLSAIEVGEVSAHMHLMASALGLQSVSISGYIEDDVERLLDIDGVTECVLLALACG